MKDAIFDDFIERLRESASIVNIVSDYVALTKKGKSYWGCCPFHQENTPSFKVDSDKGLFYCFGCKEGGNIFNFLMKKENTGFYDAVKILADKMHIPMPETEKTPREKMLEEEAKNLFKAGEMARDFYHACLLKTNYGKQAREYLAKRGVSPASIACFKLGFAPPSWDKLTLALSGRGVALDILLKAGLSVAKQSKDGVYDRFRNRIMFPICDVRGRVIGFGGRSIDNSEPKYLNSPETRLFNKRHVLYAFDLAHKHIRETGRAVIMEGYLDAVTAHAMGFENVVASLGTAFTQEQARQLLKCNSPEFIFSYDSDSAGQVASERAFAILKNMPGVKIKVVSLPGAKDPDEYLRQNGSAAFRGLIDAALPLLDYQINRVLAGIDYSDIEGEVAVAPKVAPLLAASDNEVEVSAHITRLSQATGIDENALRTEIKKETNRLKKDKNVKGGKDNIISFPSKQPVTAAAKAERQLIRLMFENNELIPYCAANLSIAGLEGSERREIIKFIINEYNMKGNISPAMLSDSSHALSDKAASELSEIMLADINAPQGNSLGAGGYEEDIARVVDDYLKAIKLADLKMLYETHRRRAGELERTGNSIFLQELAEMQRIKNEIKKLYQT